MKKQNLERPRILIADDEENYRNLLTLILDNQGWKVSQASNGKEAIEKVLSLQPDLLILDYRMPGLTGAQVYRYLQLNGINLPVVLVSSEFELQKLASSLGIVHFLNKPFDIQDLLTMIQSAYDNFLIKQ
ncbi:response regulator receiver domain protein [Calothrix sp. NIES-2100]|uniref:response regulator n=1 Tax=Calothrix sp. NIES-2100 TaxID=1954172 RepID=UPI000B60F150|nr:response regulator receiver domain protein [Calothrix sp. NIES-2100]